MGDQDQGRASICNHLKHQVSHQSRVGAVQITRWLIGEEQRRPPCKGSGQSHPLLFTPGKLVRIMRPTPAQSDLFQPGPRQRLGAGRARDLERRGDVFLRRHVGQKVEGLKNQ